MAVSPATSDAPSLLLWLLLALILALTPTLFARGLRFSSLLTLSASLGTGLLSGSAPLTLLVFASCCLLMLVFVVVLRELLFVELELLVEDAVNARSRDERDDEDDEDWRGGGGDDDPDPPDGPGLDWGSFDRLRAGWGRLPLR